MYIKGYLIVCKQTCKKLFVTTLSLSFLNRNDSQTFFQPANEVCEGYIFTPVCHSVHGGSRSLSWRGLCPRRSLSRGSLSGGSLSGGFLSGGLCPEGFCQGRSLSWRPPLYGNERALRILLECILVIINRFRSMVYMLNYPDVMKRCQAEIDEVIGRHRAPSMKDKASLPYVECTLLEIQRMTSIAPFGVCRLDTILNKNINN